MHQWWIAQIRWFLVLCLLAMEGRSSDCAGWYSSKCAIKIYTQNSILNSKLTRYADSINKIDAIMSAIRNPRKKIHIKIASKIWSNQKWIVSKQFWTKFDVEFLSTYFHAAQYLHCQVGLRTSCQSTSKKSHSVLMIRPNTPNRWRYPLSPNRDTKISVMLPFWCDSERKLENLFYFIWIISKNFDVPAIRIYRSEDLVVSRCDRKTNWFLIWLKSRSEMLKNKL